MLCNEYYFIFLIHQKQPEYILNSTNVYKDPIYRISALIKKYSKKNDKKTFFFSVKKDFENFFTQERKKLQLTLRFSDFAFVKIYFNCTKIVLVLKIL